MQPVLILALPVVIYLSLCTLPRAAGTLYTIGIVFLLAQGAIWFGLAQEGHGPMLLRLAQVGMVLAGLVQGIRLLALPETAGRGRYLALVLGGVLIGAGLMRSMFGA